MSYRARPIRYLGPWHHQGWRLKAYGISAWGERPPDELVREGELVAAATLPQPATADGRHGVGFLGVHEGMHASFVFVSWWAKLYELNHRLFRRTRGQAGDLLPVEPGLFGCTWDLHIIAFERDAWISSMAHGVDGPDLEAYLAAGISTYV
jgi:hypothetical protein